MKGIWGKGLKGALKKRYFLRENEIKNHEDLKRIICEIWHNDPKISETAINAINSMPKRIKLVIEGQG